MFNSTHKKRTESEKSVGKLYKLMSNALYSKTMENLRNRIDVKRLSSKKDYYL